MPTRAANLDRRIVIAVPIAAVPIVGCGTEPGCGWVPRYGNFVASVVPTSPAGPDVVTVSVSFEEYGPASTPRPVSVTWHFINPPNALQGLAGATVETVGAVDFLLQVSLPSQGQQPEVYFADEAWTALVGGRGRVRLWDGDGINLGEGALALASGDGLQHNGCVD